MPDLDGRVEIDGLKELQSALRRASRQAPRVIQQANKEVAEHVVDKAKQRMAQLGGVHAHVARVGGVRPRAGQRYAGVVIGGKAAKHAMALGAEFGSIQYKQFPPWRGNDTNAGYAVWPTIREQQPAIRDEYIDVLQKHILDKLAS